MLDSTSDKSNDSSQTEFTYKLIFGFLNTVSDANDLNNDPVHQEVVRVVTQLCERLRTEHPDRGIVLDVTEVVVSSEGYVV